MQTRYDFDVSWKHINKIIEAEVFISINPDAHSIDDLENMRWGVLAAQKGGGQGQYFNYIQ